MSQPDDVDRRLTAVERELADLRRQGTQSSVDASAARTLAAGADRDVSEVRAELRAHLSVLSALRETQLDHDRQFETVHAGLAQIVTLIEGLDR